MVGRRTLARRRVGAIKRLAGRIARQAQGTESIPGLLWDLLRLLRLKVEMDRLARFI